MDPVPSAWKINAWTGLWWFYAAGDGWNSSCAASAHASSSFAFLVLFGGQVDAPGAEFREEAAFSQSPGTPFWECLIQAGFSCCGTPGTPETPSFSIFSSPSHPQESPSLENVVLPQSDP